MLRLVFYHDTNHLSFAFVSCFFHYFIYVMYISNILAASSRKNARVSNGNLLRIFYSLSFRFVRPSLNAFNSTNVDNNRERANTIDDSGVFMIYYFCGGIVCKFFLLSVLFVCRKTVRWFLCVFLSVTTSLYICIFTQLYMAFCNTQTSSIHSNVENVEFSLCALHVRIPYLSHRLSFYTCWTMY